MAVIQLDRAEERSTHVRVAERATPERNQYKESALHEFVGRLGVVTVYVAIIGVSVFRLVTIVRFLAK